MTSYNILVESLVQPLIYSVNVSTVISVLRHAFSIAITMHNVF